MQLSAKNFFYIGIIAAVAAGVYFIFSPQLFLPKKAELTPETKETILKTQPTLSQEEEQGFSLLEQSAISGGPSKDGIPAVENPKYQTAADADTWLLPNDVVFGIDYKEFVAAYPQRILVWHEIANETIGDERVAITYCPLTGTTFGFKGTIAPEINSTFGVSGKLVNSNLIMYDRATDSYWPQILAQAINGPSKGLRLEEFPIVWTTWEKWKKKYPNTKVLSRETGFFRNYGIGGDPYGSYLDPEGGGFLSGNYYTSDRTLFEPLHEDGRLSPKTVVVGVRDKKGNAVAVLKDTLRNKKLIETPLGDKTLVITYDEELNAHLARIKETGEWINSFDAMWFAWFAFYPDTKLIK